MKVSTNFQRAEFACKCGCGFNAVDIELLSVLEDVRSKFNKSVTINSGCRCFYYNQVVGGEEKSKHMQAIAADIVVEGVHEDKVASYLEEKYPDRYGIGRYPGRTHIDVRPEKARWKRDK